ncbi:hypothetical protein M3899_003145 [Vibrio parahaemolyticus]|nr:hypothetical protein [Vibrio parahaemolyticus]
MSEYNNTALKALSGAINDIEQVHGVDACLDYCERQYSEMFRSDKYPLSAILGEDYDLEEARNELANESVIEQFFKSQTHYKYVPLVSDSSDYAEGFYIDFEVWQESHPDLVQSFREQITPDTLVVDIVNYKGEGEGIALFDTNKALRIFRGKFYYS